MACNAEDLADQPIPMDLVTEFNQAAGDRIRYTIKPNQPLAMFTLTCNHKTLLWDQGDVPRLSYTYEWTSNAADIHTSTEVLRLFVLFEGGVATYDVLIELMKAGGGSTTLIHRKFSGTDKASYCQEVLTVQIV